jgi:hypothetical protein
VHDKFGGGGDRTPSTSCFPVLYWADPLDEATCRPFATGDQEAPTREEAPA